MSEKLKHCPFCGGEAEVAKDEYEHITEIYVQCTECFCRTDTYHNHGDRADEECIKYAVEDWNRRLGEGEELKPCPFCGGEAEILTTDSYSGFDYCVMCISCNGNVDWCNTKEEAIEAWNRRVKNE